MKKSLGAQGNRLRAAYYSRQANLAKDAEMKKFWDNLADEWLVLSNEKDAEKEPPTEE